jgi:hypothetical protein
MLYTYLDNGALVALKVRALDAQPAATTEEKN